MGTAGGVVCNGEGSDAIAGGGRSEGDIEGTRGSESDAGTTSVSLGKVTGDSHIGNGEWTIARVVQSDDLRGAGGADDLARKIQIHRSNRWEGQREPRHF